MSVTGRVYTATRVRGLAEWSPHSKTLALLENINAVLIELVDFQPVTLRQVFYRLVATRGYPKDERAYERLGEMVKRARRAGRLDWDAIRSDGTTHVDPGGFDGMPHFWAAVRATAEGYTRNPAPDQGFDVEVLVEATGMVPQVARVARDYGVPVFSCGGFDSVTAKHDSALRVRDRARRGRRTVVLHIGDCDPSGCSIIDSAADDIVHFCVDYRVPDYVRFARIAVTPEQIALYQLEAAPQKTTDRRGEYMSQTVQAEALDPPILAAIVRAAIEAEIDLDTLEQSRRDGVAERQQLLDALATLPHGDDASPSVRQPDETQ
ncbi:MAG TPA: hypothetical protein VIP09_11760 [Dehalococcoidia bacterium]